MKVEWKRLDDVAEFTRTAIDIEPDQEYSRIGIYSWGNGHFVREPTSGLDMGKMTYFEFPKPSLVFSNIQAWEGAVALVGEQDPSIVCSSRFYPYVPRDEATISLKFLYEFFRSAMGRQIMRDASSGTQVRNKLLSRARIEAALVPVPSRAQQDRIADHLDSLEAQLSSAAQVTTSVPLLGSLPRLLGDVLRAQAAETVDLRELAANRQVVIHPGDDLRGAESFIGLEHIESHTGRSIGGRPIENETGRKLLFAPGDVTYGYLRPYLNKAWAADRFGLCSVEQFVLRPAAGVDPRLLSVLLRSDFVWDNAKAATNGLQLPRLSLKKLLAFEVPDVRSLDDPAAVLNSSASITKLVGDIDALRAHRSSVGRSILPAARNEIFTAMR